MRGVYLIELFSGTGSVSKAFKLYIPQNFKLHVFSLDILSKYNPTCRADILTWDYEKPLRSFLRSKSNEDLLFIHASPPCTEYSRAKTTARRKLKEADSIVARALEIIHKLQADYWIIENPVGLLRDRPFMLHLRPYRNTTSYCKWGESYRKNTDIWTNIPYVFLPRCMGESACEHMRLFGAHAQTVQDQDKESVYPIPAALIGFIFLAALRHHRTHVRATE